MGSTSPPELCLWRRIYSRDPSATIPVCTTAHKENPSTSSWHTPKLLWVPADSQCGVCGSWFTKSTLIWRGELTGQGCGASSTQHRGCCCLSAPEMLTQTHHRLTGESPSHPGLYRGFTRSALLACSPTQRPPKCTSYQNHDFKAEEKRVSKHLKAQMEAENFLQCCRKCHFTIPKSVEVMTLTLTAEFHFQPS